MIRYSESPVGDGVVNSVGSSGDDFDSAMAEIVNLLVSAELWRNKEPMRGQASSSSPSNGSTGSTTDACSANSATSNPLISKQITTFKTPRPGWPRPNQPGLRETRGDPVLRRDGRYSTPSRNGTTKSRGALHRAM